MVETFDYRQLPGGGDIEFSLTRDAIIAVGMEDEKDLVTTQNA